MSNASVDFPEPLTPVIIVNEFLGIATSIFFRLCKRAPFIIMNFCGFKLEMSYFGIFIIDVKQI